MTRIRTPNSVHNPGESDPMGRGLDYITLLVAAHDQFTDALAQNVKYPGFEYLLYDNDPITNQRIANFRVTSSSHDGDVRDNPPSIEVTVPIDPEDDNVTTLPEVFDPDTTNEILTITRRLFKVKEPYIFTVTYDNFDKLLDRPVSRKHSKEGKKDKTTYRDLLTLGELIPLKLPKDPKSDLMPGHL